jgi:hypothetical protein
VIDEGSDLIFLSSFSQNSLERRHTSDRHKVVIVLNHHTYQRVVVSSRHS